VNLAQYAVYLQNRNSQYKWDLLTFEDAIAQQSSISTGHRLLQEVTINDFSSLHGYEALVNGGTDKRGTAILLKQGISLSNIKWLPSGRGIAGLF